jgi:integrase
VELIDVFIANRIAIAKKKNTSKRSRTSFASSTSESYVQLQKEIMSWNPTLNIREVNQETLEEFESYLIGRRYLNSSTYVFMQKIEAVLNHFQDDYQLSKAYRNYSFELALPDDTVIFLTRAELKAFREVAIAHRNPRSVKKMNEVKDLALLMSETGLRFVDAALTRSDIKNGMIVKRQKKTGQPVYIPLTSRVKEILERHNYELRGKSVPNWNNNFRKLLAATEVPSLFEEITVKNYIGDEEVSDTRKKYDHCSAHTLRRTMINQCLMRNLRYDKITKMTGHKNFDVFQTYVDRNTNAEEMDSVFDFLNDEKLLEGVE